MLKEKQTVSIRKKSLQTMCISKNRSCLHTVSIREYFKKASADSKHKKQQQLISPSSEQKKMSLWRLGLLCRVVQAEGVSIFYSPHCQKIYMCKIGWGAPAKPVIQRELCQGRNLVAQSLKLRTVQSLPYSDEKTLMNLNAFFTFFLRVQCMCRFTSREVYFESVPPWATQEIRTPCTLSWSYLFSTE